MADVVSMQNKIDKKERRLIEKCKQIAQEIDPQASGFFRRCLERAARLGMQFEEAEAAKSQQPTTQQ